MDTGAEKAYAGARTLLERMKAKYGTAAPLQEVVEIQDLLDCIEKNADRIAYLVKKANRKKTDEYWGTVRSLLCEQSRLFKQITELFVQLSNKKIDLAALNGAAA